ncbi:hypothetical protein [Roseicella aerolata]|uniref:Uncharacterized protein n=1 Tax=Roseicella aerolata TaxID=2883479 RepID=A0A9X1IFN3_9PROT|nr:hypothetical protein [Roseicella aerolata]MCB4822215.1 hypothetical protein [Roseicella aerolata]
MRLIVQNFVVEGCAGDAVLFQDLPQCAEATFRDVRLSDVGGRAFVIEYPTLRRQLQIPNAVVDEDLGAAFKAAREQPRENAMAVIQNLTSVAALGNAAFQLAEKIVNYFQG